jgi:hypothetical protein
VGEFRIQLEEHFTAVSGAVASSVEPRDIPEIVRQSGDCRLLRRRSLFCEPACPSDMTCGPDRRCLPRPVGRNAGTVGIAGLAAPVTMTPNQLGQRYDYTRLPHPGFQPGAEVTLWATGGEVGPFVLLGRGVAPVELSLDRPVLDPGQDFALAWKAGPPGPARIAFQIEIDQHGLSQASLQCEVSDQGTAVADAALIAGLVELGASGFPRITVSRRTVDAAQVAGGCIELLVTTGIERPLTVPGHHPCRADADCPAGKTCALDVQTCR